MKISVITPTYNCSPVITDCLASVAAQSYGDVEHVVIDGASTDGTLSVLNAHKDQLAVCISERDSGIYDALNKGFTLASGDVIGILHSDDLFYDSTVLSRVVSAFKNSSVDYVYGDIEMILPDGKVARYWKTGELPEGRISGTQIPHPSLFLSRHLVEQLNPVFDSTYRISADLKQQLIFANILHAHGVYLPMPLVRMRVGGTSTSGVKAYLEGWKESRRAWNEVHSSGGSIYVLKKVFSKLSGIRF